MIAKLGFVIKPFEKEKTYYSALIGKKVNDEYVLTLFDDEFTTVKKMVDSDFNNLFDSLILYIKNEVGELIEVFEVKNDPLLIEMLNKLKS